MASSKWFGVLYDVFGLSKSVVLGRESFQARADRNPRDSVSRLFAMVWPDRSSPSGRSSLILLFVLGLSKVVLLNKSAHLLRLVAIAVQTSNSKAYKAAAKKTVLLAMLGAISSALTQWAENDLAINWREQITSQIHDRYYEVQNYYNLANLPGRAAILDPEERLSREVFSTTKRLAKIIGLLSRSMPSLIFFSYKLWTRKGAKYALIPLVYYGLAYEVAQRIFPKNLGELFRAQAQSVGGYNRSVTRVATHGEAISALGGTQVEKNVVLKKFSFVATALTNVFHATSRFGLTFKLAYIFIPRALITSLVLSPLLEESVERLSGNDSGSQIGEYRQTTNWLTEMLVANADVLTISAQIYQMQGTAYRVVQLHQTLCKLSASTDKRQLATFTTNESEIKFDSVQITTPTGVKLVEDLSFRVPRKGGRLLLTGRNGGKLSVNEYSKKKN